MKSELAEETSVLLLTLNSALNQQLEKIRESCSEEEFKFQRRGFGCAMASLLDILNPIYTDNPELKPVELGGTYRLPESHFEEILSTLYQGVSDQMHNSK